MHLYNESLELSNAGVGKHNVTVRFGVSYKEAESRHPNTPIDVQITLIGRDLILEDQLITFGDHFNSSGQNVQTLEFRHTVADSVLNGDIGHDEVYAEIVARNGAPFNRSNKVHTNTVRGRF